ncbi:TonB-dependent receptor [Sphingobacterium sp. DN00404]|uniref:TonB-dependent receptor n=1 Tax=Sphingobacterium micropteri TaxID=2763501 RepID=A0ABR7YQX8_9SPHI|nr:TonB-dependent receptor [Sphingobacterium micropteri]MBD1433732.1 TonB-dependent receptor [Sphingobacterium micropteri]
MNSGNTYNSIKKDLLGNLFFLFLSTSCMAQLDTVLHIDSVVVDARIDPSWNRTVLNKHDLTQRNATSFGELLSSTAGVQNAYHGPHAGSPMIRSMSGNRVRILRNNTSISDLSGISPNFTISFDPDNISDIHIYKSQSSVLYGGRAIGGAINIVDNSIPKNVPAKPITGSVKTSWQTNAGHLVSFDLNGKTNEQSTWHVDGSWRQNGDIRIPSHPKIDWAYNPTIDNMQASMAQVFVDKESKQNITLYPYLSQFVLDNMGDPSQGLSEAEMYTFKSHSVIGGYEVPNPANPQYIPDQDPSIPLYTTVVHGIYDYAPVRNGYIPNSHADHKTINIGYAWHTSNMHIGIGYRGNQGYFGIPGFARIKQPSHAHSHGDDHQHRAEDFGYSPINTRALSNNFVSDVSIAVGSPWLSSIKNSYSLQLADDRELLGIYQMNKFNSNIHSNRLEFHQSYQAFWKGLSGLDLSYRKITGTGIMRYMPHTRSQEWSAFTQQQFAIKSLRLSTGYRIEHVHRKAIPDAAYKRSRGLSGGNLSPRNYKLQQFNSELSWKILSFLRVMGSYQHAERAPEINELYAGNNHFAIMTEENGDDRLPVETNDGIEFGMEFNSLSGWNLKSTYYHNTFKNYLYLAHTGISRSGGFLVKEWRASDTEISGWEVELSQQTIFAHGAKLFSQGYFDLVKNRNTSDDPMRQWAEGDFMPNMPTSRFGFATKLDTKNWSLYVAADSYLKQKLLGKNINPEPPMPAFTLLHAKISHRLPWSKYHLEAYIQGGNLLNSEARPQQSILKYLSPLPGRNISMGIQMAI